MTRLFLGVLVALVACSPPPQKPKGDGAKLVAVPDFDFEERAGGRITRQDLKGKVWVASFIFTSCTTSCIPMCGEMAKLQDEFADDPDFRVVAVTVDPEVDTAEKLDKHGKLYGARPDRWLFLRNDIEKTRAFAHEGLKIAWLEDTPLIHSSYFVVVDRDGWVRGYYNQTHLDRMKTLRTTLRKVLDEKNTSP